MINLTILILITFNIYAHQGFAPPVDSTNSGGMSHSGFGNIGGDDYEASQKLRKQCLPENIEDHENVITCFYKDYNFFDLDVFTGSVGKSVTTMKMQSYAASVLASEIENITGETIAADKKSCHGIQRLDPAPHNEVRESALSINNAVSASLLDKMFGNQNKDYSERIKRNYPYLFIPDDDAGDEILDLVKDNLDDAYIARGRMFDHYSTMTAFEAMLETDETFKKEINEKIAKIQTKYANNLKEKLINICNTPMRLISTDLPGVFDQFLVDQNDVERAVSKIALCDEEFYYDKSEFDSDCDGIPDDKDPKPRDSLNPLVSIDIDGKNYINPPFGKTGKYNLTKISTDKVKLTRKIKINQSGLNAEDSSEFLEKFGICRDMVEENIQTAFSEFKEDNETYKDKGLELDLSFESTTSQVDFTVHKCWCSTCTLKYRDENDDVRNVPKDTCREDFTPEMEAALNDETLNPDSKRRRWWKQADAANLTLSSADSCKTVQHEIMHKLGLSDEYVADYYPFNLVSDHNSLMNNGDRLFPRHIGDLLSPKLCRRDEGLYGL